MLSRNERWVIFGACLLALLLVDFEISSPGPCARGEQQQAQKGGKRGCDLTETITYRTFGRVVDWIDRRHDFVTAAGTLVLALFTITLWRATSGLLKSAKEQGAQMRASTGVAQHSADAARDSASAAREANQLNRDIFVA
jgi:hypothetical protein